MPWKAMKHLLENNGMCLGFEDSQKLLRLIMVKGDATMVRYKEALTHISPNMDQDDPVRAVWVLRKNPAPYESSKLGSRHSSMSYSPSN